MADSKDSSIDIDTGRASMKLSTLISIIVAVITLCVGAVTWGVGTATKADVETVMLKHSEVPHHINGKAVSAPAEIVPKVEANERAVQALQESTADLHKKVDAQGKQATYINAKLEFLVEREMIQAQGDPEARNAVRRAARSVRSRASASGAKGDPLAGLEGL